MSRDSLIATLTYLMALSTACSDNLAPIRADTDARSPDAAASGRVDAAPTVDAAAMLDAPVPDAALPDAPVSDAMLPDASSPDAALADAAPADAVMIDAAPMIDAGMPDAQPGPTYTHDRDILPIWQMHCSCHGRSPGAGGLVLNAQSAYTNLVNVLSAQSSLDRIEPGSPMQSYLWLKVTGAPGILGTPMPPLVRLSDGDLAKIETWITEGAPR